jgi:hypothetical protein
MSLDNTTISRIGDYYPITLSLFTSNWRGIALASPSGSYDGNYLFALAADTGDFLSFHDGWAAIAHDKSFVYSSNTRLPGRDIRWSGIAASRNGSRLFLAEVRGGIFISTDWGATGTWVYPAVP